MFKNSWGYTLKTRVGFKKFYRFFIFCQTYFSSLFASRGLIKFYLCVYLCEKYFVTLKNFTLLFLNFFFYSKTYAVISVVSLQKRTLYKFQFLSGFVLWDSHSVTNAQPIFNYFVKPGELKYKFFGKDSENFLKNEYYNMLLKYCYLGLIFFKRFSYYPNTKPFLKNNVITNSFLVTPKFSSSSVNKYIDLNNLTQYQYQYLRKNKVYNKGRYSRNRQNYRTGVYMCLYLSVISIFGLYYSFYKFAFKFTYLWWFFIAFAGSFILPKAIKYRLYEPTMLLKRFFDLYVWFISLLRPFFEKFNKFF